MRIFLIFMVLLIIPAMAQAQGKLLAVDLAKDHVDITTGFTGAHISLFGVQEQDGHIAIIIRGPKHRMVVRRKENVFGVWMNRAGMGFEDVPVYYDYALSADEEEIASASVRKANFIGVDTLRFAPDDDKSNEETVQAFQEALIRNKQMERLFPVQPQRVDYIDDRFFRASFYIPANVPTGMYTVETFLLQKGKVKAVQTTELKVAQVGKSADIYNFARSWSFTYGVLCVIFAMGVGWLSNSIRRRLR